MVECRLVDECFAAFKLKKGKWVPCTLRVTNTAVERLDNMLTVLWRARFVDMKSPGAPTFVLGPANFSKDACNAFVILHDCWWLGKHVCNSEVPLYCF